MLKYLQLGVSEGDVTPKFSIKVQDADGNWQTVHTHVPYRT